MGLCEWVYCVHTSPVFPWRVTYTRTKIMTPSPRVNHVQSERVTLYDFFLTIHQQPGTVDVPSVDEK